MKLFAQCTQSVVSVVSKVKHGLTIIGWGNLFQDFWNLAALTPFVHNSWSLDRISWAFLQALITNNLQIFSDIIKANKATALANPKSHFFMLTSSRCCPRWRPRPCLNESIFYPFYLETCIFQKNIKVFPTIATFLNLKNKANVCEWVNLRHAYGTYNVKSMKKNYFLKLVIT
jgi:hypothetical protein